MKTLHLYIIAIGFMLGACNPMEDIYNDLDDTKVPYSASLEYTLLSSDYETISKYVLSNLAENATDSSYAYAIKSDMAFNQRIPHTYFMSIPLMANFPSLRVGSSVLATFNTLEKPEELAKYETALEYTFVDADYDSVGGNVAKSKSFFPSAPPELYVPKILNSAYKNALEGDIIAASYNYSKEEGEAPEVYFEEDFEAYQEVEISIGSIDGWSQYLEKGTREWISKEYDNDKYAQFSSYKSGEENINYLITPPIMLNSAEHQFSFDLKVGYWTHDGLEIFISPDYDGSDFIGATWNNVTSSFNIPQQPTDGYGDFQSAGILDISNYSGTVYIAFKYTGEDDGVEDTDDKTTTYQIDDIVVKQILEVEVNPELISSYYKYDGTEWGFISNSYILTPWDYQEIGVNVLSSLKAPSHYIPIFLKNRYPYAIEEDEILVSYNYDYDGSVARRADSYTLIDDNWTSKSEGAIVELTEQFSFSPEQEVWLPDPTVRVKLANSDYTIFVDYTRNNHGEGYLYDPEDPNVDNTEYYYGVSSHYNNMDKNGFDDEVFSSWEEAIQAGFETAFLKSRFPDAEAQVNGLDVYYELTFDTYSRGDRPVYTIIFQCTKSGPDPEFEFIELIEL